MFRPVETALDLPISSGILDLMNGILMKIIIKNMVALGTRRFVLMELKKLGLKVVSFESGEIEFEKRLSGEENSSIEESLRKYGLELVSDRPEAAYYSYNINNSSKYLDDSVETDEVMEIAEAGQAN